jgi:hypothetical protein
MTQPYKDLAAKYFSRLAGGEGEWIAPQTSPNILLPNISGVAKRWESGDTLMDLHPAPMAALQTPLFAVTDVTDNANAVIMIKASKLTAKELRGSKLMVLPNMMKVESWVNYGDGLGICRLTLTHLGITSKGIIALDRSSSHAEMCSISDLMLALSVWQEATWERVRREENQFRVGEKPKFPLKCLHVDILSPNGKPLFGTVTHDATSPAEAAELVATVVNEESKEEAA